MKPEQVIYAIPRKGVDPEGSEKRYRGIDRWPLLMWREEWLDESKTNMPDDFRAASALGVIVDRGGAEDEFIFNHDDALDVFSKLDQPDAWEMIWAADADAHNDEPDHSKLLGFDPTWFYGDHFSAIADSMFFPTWHGSDKEGALLLDHFVKLNEHGLFPTSSLAKDFLGFYQSFEWAETGEFIIAKIMAV